MRDFLVPVFIAFFTAMVLYPLINKLHNTKIPNWLSTVIVYLSFIIFVGIFLSILTFSLLSFLKDLPIIITILNIKIDDIIKAILDVDLIKKFLSNIKLSDIFANLSSEFISFENLQKPVNISFDIIKGFALYAIALIFIIPGMERISKRILKAFPDREAVKINKMIINIIEQFENYMVAKSIISFLVGIFTTIFCAIFKVKYPLLWGIVAFILNFIPFIGPSIAVILPTLLLLIQDKSLITLSFFLALLIGMHVIMGNIVEPKFMSEGVNLSPIVIFVSLLIWGYVWGIAGVVLSIPITSALNIIFENIDQLRPFSVLISSRKRIIKK